MGFTWCLQFKDAILICCAWRAHLRVNNEIFINACKDKNALKCQCFVVKLWAGIYLIVCVFYELYDLLLCYNILGINKLYNTRVEIAKW